MYGDLSKIIWTRAHRCDRSHKRGQNCYAATKRWSLIKKWFCLVVQLVSFLSISNPFPWTILYYVQRSPSLLLNERAFATIFNPVIPINFNYKIVKSIIKVNRRSFVLRNKIIYVLLRVYYLILRIFNDPTVQRLLESTMISLDRSLVQGQTISIIKVSNIDGVVTFT